MKLLIYGWCFLSLVILTGCTTTSDKSVNTEQDLETPYVQEIALPDGYEIPSLKLTTNSMEVPFEIGGYVLTIEGQTISSDAAFLIDVVNTMSATKISMNETLIIEFETEPIMFEIVSISETSGSEIISTGSSELSLTEEGVQSYEIFAHYEEGHVSYVVKLDVLEK